MSIDAAKKAKHEKAVTDHRHKNPNLLGIGVGHKEVGGKFTSDLAVKFFVRAKRAERRLSKSELLPKTINGVPTDVVQLAPLRASGNLTQRFRPALGGCSGCVVTDFNYTGTLGVGMRGWDSLAGRSYVLSNNHVLANENRARIGDSVIQPGTLDGGHPTRDKIGELTDFVPLLFASSDRDPNPLRKVNHEQGPADGVLAPLFWVHEQLKA